MPEMLTTAREWAGLLDGDADLMSLAKGLARSGLGGVVVGGVCWTRPLEAAFAGDDFAVDDEASR